MGIRTAEDYRESLKDGRNARTAGGGGTGTRAAANRRSARRPRAGGDR